jgi:hypothetical protein
MLLEHTNRHLKIENSSYLHFFLKKKNNILQSYVYKVNQSLSKLYGENLTLLITIARKLL